MYDVITIGTATEDVFLKSPFFKGLDNSKKFKKGILTDKTQCFALGSKIEIDELFIASGGGATNTAVTFSKQGFKTACLIRTGKDKASETIIKELQKEKINPFVIKDGKQRTAYSTILLSPEGERTILVFRGTSDDFKNKEIPFDKLKSKWVYISPGNINFSVIQKVFNHFYKNKILIAFNPSKNFLNMGARKLKPLLSKSKVVILNREEASYLTGINYNDENNIFKKLDDLVDGIAVMTQGPKGVSVSDGKTIYQAKIFSGKVIDRTGAGDAFGSGFVSGLIHKNSIKYAICLGTANATSVVEYIGAKKGILTEKDFKKNSRWKNLSIKTIKLK
ncbi:carbohydrate kinase family protein [Candidatus Wolfebacteria bacterium]|nr:carbohydrate kinase family protein [Candidatus Wolfebacteria bacterium]